MARVSVDDCLDKVPNRYMLIHLAIKRARQMAMGQHPLLKCSNKIIVTALREIAAGKVVPTLIDKMDI